MKKRSKLYESFLAGLFILTIILTISVTHSFVFAEAVTEDNISEEEGTGGTIPLLNMFEYDYIDENAKEIAITGYLGTEPEIEIPAMIDGNKVVSIWKKAFLYNDVVQKITISEGITEICDEAFSDCYSLREVHLPNTISSIGKRAFHCCSLLESINIPDGITIIQEETFCRCSALESIVLPESVETIGTRAFDSAGIIGLTIPESVKTIGDAAFSYCPLTEVSLPSGLETINNETFYGCAFQTIDIPTSIKAIGANAFSGCITLKSLIIPKNVNTIGRGAFYGCIALEEVSIEKNSPSLYEGAFQECTSLRSFTIDYPYAPGIANINVFDGHKPSFRIHVPKDAKGYDAEPWSALPVVYDLSYTDEGSCGDNITWEYNEGVLRLSGSGEMYDYPYGGSPWWAVARNIATIEVSEWITSIGSSAFINCSKITNIILPTSIEA